MPPFIKKFLISFSVFFLFILSSQNIFALELKSKYFEVHIHKDIDSYKLLRKLNINYFLHLDMTALKASPNLESMLRDTLDAIYLEVSDILDMHMYSFRVYLEILPNKNYLSKILQEHSRKEINISSFYFYEKNTIYISAEDLRVGMLGHEVAHAIISHYFVVPPPAKVQEILSGYVEYSLNKSTDK
ncbi:MAG: hypothetical protein ISS45_09095 [Candidatus Omnitrophica bacterium]|nr:hypothetical protein [Candidatus Omnitrophota bacterium]